MDVMFRRYDFRYKKLNCYKAKEIEMVKHDYSCIKNKQQ
jgi:hypothetical protein